MSDFLHVELEPRQTVIVSDDASIAHKVYSQQRQRFEVCNFFSITVCASKSNTYNLRAIILLPTRNSIKVKNLIQNIQQKERPNSNNGYDDLIHSLVFILLS